MRTVVQTLPFDRKLGFVCPGIYVHFSDEQLSSGTLVKVRKPDGHYGHVFPNDLVMDDLLLVLEHRPGTYFHILCLRTLHCEYLSGQDSKLGDDGYAYLFEVLQTIE